MLLLCICDTPWSHRSRELYSYESSSWASSLIEQNRPAVLVFVNWVHLFDLIYQTWTWTKPPCALCIIWEISLIFVMKKKMHLKVDGWGELNQTWKAAQVVRFGSWFYSFNFQCWDCWDFFKSVLKQCLLICTMELFWSLQLFLLVILAT